VQFAPTVVGMRNATMNILCDDIDEATFDFTIQGMGAEPTSVVSADASSYIRMYPNPTSDKVTVAMTVRKDEEVAVSIIDMQGREVMKPVIKSYKAGEHTVTLNTEHLHSGLYFIKVSSGPAYTNMKLVIMH